MHLTDTIDLSGRIIDELSGGERQRVIIAMALAQEPEILLLDEPTHLLDITRQAEIMDLVAELNRERGLTVVAAIHDLNLAGRYFNRLVILHRGAVLAEGRPEPYCGLTLWKKLMAGLWKLYGRVTAAPPSSCRHPDFATSRKRHEIETLCLLTNVGYNNILCM